MEQKKILFVDDNEAIIKALSLLIETQPEYRLDIARNGLEAIEKLKQGEYDLVITDVVMPSIGGWKLLDYIRENIHIPTVVITGYSHVLDEKEALRRGAAAYLQKPFDYNDLLKVIKNLIP